MPLLYLGLMQASYFNAMTSFWQHFRIVPEAPLKIHKNERRRHKIGDRILVRGKEYEVIGVRRK